jgi:hypothetical protein
MIYFNHHFPRISIHSIPMIVVMCTFLVGLIVTACVMTALEKNPNLFDRFNQAMSQFVSKTGAWFMSLWTKMCNKFKTASQPSITTLTSQTATAAELASPASSPSNDGSSQAPSDSHISVTPSA